MAERQFQKGDVIFKEGDKANEAYIVTKGTVEILKHAHHGDVLLATLNSGDVFGEMGLFEDAPRSATARAAEITNVDIIDTKELDQMMMACPEGLRSIVNTVFDRLRNTSQQLSEQNTADTIVDCNFDKITVSPVGEYPKGAFEPLTVSVAQLPLRIGGYNPDVGEPLLNSHINIPCEGPPLRVSRRHIVIEAQDNVIKLFDRGSRFGTVIDDKNLGKGKGRYSISLEKGSYELILGGKGAPYAIKVECQ